MKKLLVFMFVCSVSLLSLSSCFSLKYHVETTVDSPPRLKATDPQLIKLGHTIVVKVPLNENNPRLVGRIHGNTYTLLLDEPVSDVNQRHFELVGTPTKYPTSNPIETDYTIRVF